MPLQIVRQDITKMNVDAIVNPTNRRMIPGGGVDSAIHKAAGVALLGACLKAGGCPVGQARVTKGYKLPCKYIIHTAGPAWKGGAFGEEALLESCYKHCLERAVDLKVESIAIPLIASGLYGFPKDKVLSIAIKIISRFLLENEMMVYLVVFDRRSYQLSEKLFKDVTAYIDDNYVEAHVDYFMMLAPRSAPVDAETVESEQSHEFSIPVPMMQTSPEPDVCLSVYNPEKSKETNLNDILKKLDESFSQMLFRKIDEKGMTDVECYKKANINRKLFSKIRSDVNYKPSKPTVIAFAVSLELSLAETEEMLKKAGFALSHSNKFDVIIEYFITKGIYNIFEINETLFTFDQSLLGG